MSASTEHDANMQMELSKPSLSNVSFAGDPFSEEDDEELDSSTPDDASGQSGIAMGQRDPELSRFIRERMVQGTSNLYAEALERMERQLIAEVLHFTDGN